MSLVHLYGGLLGVEVPHTDRTGTGNREGEPLGGGRGRESSVGRLRGGSLAGGVSRVEEQRGGSAEVGDDGERVR